MDAPLLLTTCQVDLALRQVRRETGVVGLSELEVKLLSFLEQHPGRTIPRESLLVEVWGYRPGLHTRAVDNTVMRLRSKIEADPRQPDHLLTVRGVGYRWQPLRHALVGRAEVLRQLQDTLDRGSRLIALVGPGGVGKTSVARQLPGVFCDLCAVHTLEGLHRAVRATLGLGAAQPVEEALAAATDTVLILDNFEQLAALGPQTLTPWAAALPEGSALVVTSRERLRLAAEEVIPVEPLSVEDACRLLQRRVGRPLVIDDALQSLLGALGGLPLAVELAAGWLDLLRPDQLQERLLALSSRQRDCAPRHRSLSAVFTQSWALLSEAERVCLGMLSLFAGGAALDAIEGIITPCLPPGAEPVVALLASLQDRSLIGMEGDRVQLLESIRGAARERLEDAEAAELRHARWFITQAHEWWEQSWMWGHETPWYRLAVEVDNLLAVERRMLDREPGLSAWALIISQIHLQHREPGTVSLARIARIEQRMRPEDAVPHAELLVQKASALYRIGRSEPGLVAMKKAVVLLEGVDPIRQGRMRCNLANTMLNLRQLDAVEDAMQALLAGPTTPWTRGTATARLGMVRWFRGEIADARDHWLAAVGILEEAGILPSVRLFKRFIARAELDLGLYDSARGFLEIDLSLAEQGGQPRVAAMVQMYLGLLEHAEGALPAAGERLQVAVDLWRTLGDPVYIAYSLAARARLRHEQGDLSGARQDLQEASPAAPVGARGDALRLEIDAGLGLLAAEDGMDIVSLPDDARLIDRLIIRVARARHLDQPSRAYSPR